MHGTLRDSEPTPKSLCLVSVIGSGFSEQNPVKCGHSSKQKRWIRQCRTADCAHGTGSVDVREVCKMPYQRLRRLVDGFSPQRSGFASRAVHVGFVNKVKLEQGFLWVLWFAPVNIIPPMLRIYSCIIWGTDNETATAVSQRQSHPIVRINRETEKMDGYGKKDRRIVSSLTRRTVKY